MTELRISEVTKMYGQVLAVDKVSILVEDGEFVVLVGPSGCGKSSILRMIAGLEEVTSGDIFLGPRRVTDTPPRDRDLAMVFQSYALYPFKTVAENLAFPLRMRRTSDAEITRKIAEVADILELSEMLTRYPRQLSGGQRQRVAMGRSIVRDPSAFLFDEPLSNLDATLRVVMRGQIKELQRRLRKTMVFVTHDQVEAMTMADRIVVLRGGRIEQMGPPLDLYDRPANTFVATFLGSPAMNLLRGRIESSAEGLRFRGADDIDLPLPDGAAVPTGTEMTFGFRPEHAAFVSEGTPGAIAAEVSVVEPTGSETVVVARRNQTAIVASTRERLALDVSARIWLRPEPGRVHLFRADGTRLSLTTSELPRQGGASP